MKRLGLSIGLLLAAVLPATMPAVAQSWPAKTVRIIVPFGPGSTPDVVARLIADSLQQKYPGSAFVVENKPGASGDIGTDMVAKGTRRHGHRGQHRRAARHQHAPVSLASVRSKTGYRRGDPAGHHAERARSQSEPECRQRQ